MDAKEIQKRLNVDSISVINAKAPVNLITEALGPVDSRAGVTQEPRVQLFWLAATSKVNPTRPTGPLVYTDGATTPAYRPRPPTGGL